MRGRGLLPGVRARGGGAVSRRGALSLDEALFGAAVALLRERRHLSQESLGEAALLTQFAVSRIERGRPCDLEVRGRLLAALGAAPESALLNQLESVLEDARARAERAARALREIAKIAREKETGARGLRSIIEGVMLDIMFELPDQPRGSRYVVTDDIVEGRAKLFNDEPPATKSA